MFTQDVLNSSFGVKKVLNLDQSIHRNRKSENDFIFNLKKQENSPKAIMESKDENPIEKSQEDAIDFDQKWKNV